MTPTATASPNVRTFVFRRPGDPTPPPVTRREDPYVPREAHPLAGMDLRQCIGKTRYRRFSVADAIRRQCQEQRGTLLKVYLCTFCNRYHLAKVHVEELRLMAPPRPGTQRAVATERGSGRISQCSERSCGKVWPGPGKSCSCGAPLRVVEGDGCLHCGSADCIDAWAHRASVREED